MRPRPQRGQGWRKGGRLFGMRNSTEQKFLIRVWLESFKQDTKDLRRDMGPAGFEPAIFAV